MARGMPQTGCQILDTYHVFASPGSPVLERERQRGGTEVIIYVIWARKNKESSMLSTIGPRPMVHSSSENTARAVPETLFTRG